MKVERDSIATGNVAPRRPWLWGPRSAVGLGIAAATFAIDQANKLWMLFIYDLPSRGRVPVLPFLDLVYVKNTGVSYGLAPGLVGPWALAGFAVLVSLAMAVWLARDIHTRIAAASLGLIMGGALGNAVDRLHLGGVADFYSLHALGFYWYVFNIADVAIVAGVIGLVYDTMIVSRKDAAKPS